ncbi:MAG: DUF4340 domain-containing protein [Saprospiraceae bacterium]|nr:DUF4340 domain-containing protein [Saprospiraceae bacterium]
MMKRLIVIIGLTLLALLAWKNSKDKPDVAEDFRFAVPEISTVAKVTISDRAGRKVMLERQDGYWSFNEDYRAREDAIFNLLKTIQQMELAYIPGPQALKNIVKGLSSQGLKVSIFNRNDKHLKSYFIGGSTPDERGTYIIMEGSDQPAVVTLPNFEGSLRTRFDMVDLDWRDRIVFRYDQENIGEVKVVYHQTPKASFVLYRTGSNWKVRPHSDEIGTGNEEIRRGSAEAYLRAYKKVGAESILSKSTAATLNRMNPFCSITVISQSGDSEEVTFYPVQQKGGETSRDRIGRYICEDQNGTSYLVQHAVFSDLFVSLDFFL